MFWTADVFKNEKGTISFASQSALPLRFSYSKTDTSSNVWSISSAFPFHPNAFAYVRFTIFDVRFASNAQQSRGKTAGGYKVVWPKAQLLPHRGKES